MFFKNLRYKINAFRSKFDPALGSTSVEKKKKLDKKNKTELTHISWLCSNYFCFIGFILLFTNSLNYLHSFEMYYKGAVNLFKKLIE